MSCPTIIQVTNISPQATKQQMVELFSYLGDIVELKLFPDDDSRAVPSKVCFVNFKEVDSVSTSLHLTNTIFIDRALVISRSRYDSIPGEEDAMSLAAPAVAIAANQTKSVGHTAPLLPTPPSMGAAVTPGLAGIAPGIPAVTTVNSSVASSNPMPNLTPPTLPSQPLISMMGTMVPPAPPLTGNVDPSKIEEIRRTVYVGNLNSSLTADQVLNFFLPCGEIKYVRMAGDETQPTRFVFVEFARPESVPIALQYNGAMFGDRPVKVNHSKNAIVKPQGPSAQETQREVDEAMRKVKEATAAITAVIEEPEVDKKSHSRSKSRSRSRSRSRDRRRRRSRSYDRYRGRRSRSRSPYNRRGGGGRSWRDLSRSPRRRYSRSRSPRRRSRTPPPRRRSRSPPPRRRSRSPPPARRRSRTPPRRLRSRTPPSRRRSRSIGRRRSRSPGRGRRRRSPSRSHSRERKRKERKRYSRSPTPPRSSRKRRHQCSKSRSRSKSPFGPAAPMAAADNPAPSSSNSRSKKKKHKHHRRKNHTPSPSPSPSPPPKAADSEEEGKSSGGSPGSPMSPGSHSSDKSGMSVGSPPLGMGGGRGSLSPRRGGGSGEEEARRSSGSSSPAAANADTDSSYD